MARIAWGVALVPALLLVLLPATSAQVPPVAQDGLTLEVQPWADPIATELDVRIPYKVTYTVGAPNAGGLGVVVRVPEMPPGWLLTPVPDRHTTPDSPEVAGTHVFEGHVLARHDGTPLAFRPETIAVQAHAEGDEKAVRPLDASADVVVKADWRPGLQVKVAASRVVLNADGDAVAFGEIVNTGNARAKVTPEVALAPDGCTVGPISGAVEIEPAERANLRIELDCGSRSTGTLTARVTHALASEPARLGTPVSPVWDVVDASAGGGTGPSRTFGDEPREPKYDTPWGATLLGPASLAIAALLRRRA